MMKKIVKFNKYIILFFLVTIFQFCAKKVVLTDIEFQRQLLSGTGTYQNIERNWRLDSAYINGAAVVLTPYQRTYIKTFVHDGVYKDSELNNGKWELLSLNNLKQKIIYASTNKIDSTSFEILLINTAQLKLKLNNSTVKTEYLFKIVN
jgi:hypothetical protein